MDHVCYSCASVHCCSLRTENDKHKKHITKKDPQKKHCPGTVSEQVIGELNIFQKPYSVINCTTLGSALLSLLSPCVSVRPFLHLLAVC